MRVFNLFLILTMVYTVGGINLWKTGFRLLPDHLSQIINTIPVSKNCTTQLKAVIEGVKSHSLWALEMLDATAKPMPGILRGNLQQLGNYDQCIQINARVNASEIEGKYCDAMIVKENNSELLTVASMMEDHNIHVDGFHDGLKLYVFSWDFCIPAACSVDDLQLIVNTFIKKGTLKYTLQFSEENCHHKSKPNNYNSVDYFALVFLSVVFLLIGSSTACDLYKRYKENNFDGREVRLVRVFSLYSNLTSLLFAPSAEEVLSCISGLRVISMFWIVISHHFLIALYVPVFYPMNKLQFPAKPQNFLLIGSTLSVDTFFVISGLLVSYNFLLLHKKGIKITLVYFYLHRLLRLLPPLSVLILLYASVLRFAGDGPLWFIWTTMIYNQCRKSWWWNLLFIENYSEIDRCAHHGWYVSVDTQLYALSPLFLFPLLRQPKRIIKMLLGVIFVSIMNTFIISWKGNFGVNFVQENTENVLYLPTYIRAPAYLFGSILGYLIYTSRFAPVQINKTLVKYLWVVSSFMLLYLPYLYYSISNLEEPSVLKTALLNSLSRPAWSVCVCWVIYACTTGHGRIVNKFLSMPFFTVLSRITYSMYLTHLLVMQNILYRNRGSINFSNLYLYRNAVGDYFFVCLFATAWNLCFESPILVAEKMLIKRGSQKTLKIDKYDKDKMKMEMYNGKLIN